MAQAAPEIVELVGCIERFCALPAREGGPELAADLTELRRGSDLIELKFSEMAAAFAGTNEYDAQGSVSPIHWIRLNCHMSGGAAADRVAVGEQVANLSQATEAMAGGEIGFPHLALIARTASAVAEATRLSTRPLSWTKLDTPASAASATSAITCGTPPIPRVMRPSRHRESRRGR